MNGNTVYHGLEPEDKDDPRIDDEEGGFLQCPSCHSEQLFDKGETYENDVCIGTEFACKDCGHHFVDEIGRDWENYS